jgi:hypothetical protein
MVVDSKFIDPSTAQRANTPTPSLRRTYFWRMEDDGRENGVGGRGKKTGHLTVKGGTFDFQRIMLKYVWIYMLQGKHTYTVCMYVYTYACTSIIDIYIYNWHDLPGQGLSGEMFYIF